MPGPLSHALRNRQQRGPGARPRRKPTRKQLKSRAARARNMLRMFEFTEDGFYPTFTCNWRRISVSDLPSGVPAFPDPEGNVSVRVVLCQLWRHESVRVDQKAKVQPPVPPELERWVPIQFSAPETP